MRSNKTSVVTTSIMQNAVDDVEKICSIPTELAIPRSHIHCAVALSVMIFPFARGPQPYDFSAGIDSISVSRREMVGSPIPRGIVLATPVSKPGVTTTRSRLYCRVRTKEVQTKWQIALFQDIAYIILCRT